MSSQSYFFNPQDDRMSCAGSGLQLPRLSTAQRLALSVGMNDAGLQVFDLTLQSTFVWTGAAWVLTYQSGTWNATFVDDGAGATFTLTSPTASFERIGDQVHVSGRWNVSGRTGVGTGALFITDLPFPVRTGDAYAASAAVWGRGFSVGAVTQLVGIVDSSAPTNIVVSHYQNGNLNPLSPHVQVNTQIAVNLTYRTA